MNLGERLRGVIKPGPGTRSWAPAPGDWQSDRGPNPESRIAADAAQILGGEWRETRGQRFLVVDRKYLPGHRHGRVCVADALPSSDGQWPRLSLLAGAPCDGQALFIDLETTGLAGGAGTYAFLVGCAWFQDGTFRVRQFFLSSFSAERALLDAVAEAAGAAGTVITYNGKSFDLPLMETRYVMHRTETPFAGMPHVDMLHPARRLWRNDGPVEADPQVGPGSGCRLSELEQTLCGHEREGDVPGFEIPARYFQYVRSGDSRPLAAVFEHNRLDLLSLALLTARAAQLLEEGAAATCTAREALGLGRLYERGGMTLEARECYARAADAAGAETLTRADALRACAMLSRRLRRYEEAAGTWRRLLDLRRCPPQYVREATEALAVHHEHRLRDPLSARTFALKSLQLHASPSRREAVEHRLARLNRKLGTDGADAVPLF